MGWFEARANMQEAEKPVLPPYSTFLSFPFPSDSWTSRIEGHVTRVLRVGARTLESYTSALLFVMRDKAQGERC